MVESTETKQADGSGRVASAALVGEQLPKAMGPSDMCRAFNISRQTFYNREKAQAFRPFLLARPIGKKRYSGERVQAFLNGRG